MTEAVKALVEKTRAFIDWAPTVEPGNTQDALDEMEIALAAVKAEDVREHEVAVRALRSVRDAVEMANWDEGVCCSVARRRVSEAIDAQLAKLRSPGAAEEAKR